MLNKVQKQMYLLVATSICVVFAIGYLLLGNIAGGHGMFEGIGNIVEDVVTPDVPLINDSFTKLETATTQAVPMPSYIGGTQVVGDTAKFKDLLLLSQGGYVYLKDIKEQNGISVLENHTIESFEQMKEITSPFIYIKETDTLYFCKSGCFTMIVSVYGTNGANTEFDFLLPVEIGGE